MKTFKLVLISGKIRRKCQNSKFKKFVYNALCCNFCVNAMQNYFDNFAKFYYL